MNSYRNHLESMLDFSHGVSASWQRDVQNFVNREILFCASEIVDHILDTDLDIDIDFLVLREKMPTLTSEKIAIVNEDAYYRIVDTGEDFQLWEGEDLIDTGYSEDEILQCAEDSGFDFAAYGKEVLEHWIVSSWLADLLESKGESIVVDFYGLTIWGRTTSGQAIAMDSVIQEIYYETQIKEDIS